MDVLVSFIKIKLASMLLSAVWFSVYRRCSGDFLKRTFLSLQVLFNAWPRQRGLADHDGPAGGDGVRHGGPEAATVRPDRQEPGEQEPSQAAAAEVSEEGQRLPQLRNYPRERSREAFENMMMGSFFGGEI